MSDYEAALRAWAVRQLGVRPEDLVEFDADVVGGCGNDTCEYNIVEFTATLADGRVMVAEGSFGLFLQDIVGLALNEDGTRREDWWPRDFEGVEFVERQPRP